MQASRTHRCGLRRADHPGWGIKRLEDLFQYLLSALYSVTSCRWRKCGSGCSCFTAKQNTLGNKTRNQTRVQERTEQLR